MLFISELPVPVKHTLTVEHVDLLCTRTFVRREHKMFKPRIGQHELCQNMCLILPIITGLYMILPLCVDALDVIIWTIVAIGTCSHFNPLKKYRVLFVMSREIKIKLYIECAVRFVDCIVWIDSAIHLHHDEMEMNGGCKGYRFRLSLSLPVHPVSPVHSRGNSDRHSRCRNRQADIPTWFSAVFPLLSTGLVHRQLSRKRDPEQA